MLVIDFSATKDTKFALIKITCTNCVTPGFVACHIRFEYSINQAHVKMDQNTELYGKMINMIKELQF